MVRRQFVCGGNISEGTTPNIWGCAQHYARQDELNAHFRSPLGRRCINQFVEAHISRPDHSMMIDGIPPGVKEALSRDQVSALQLKTSQVYQQALPRQIQQQMVNSNSPMTSTSPQNAGQMRPTASQQGFPVPGQVSLANADSATLRATYNTHRQTLMQRYPGLVNVPQNMAQGMRQLENAIRLAEAREGQHQTLISQQGAGLYRSVISQTSQAPQMSAQIGNTQSQMSGMDYAQLALQQAEASRVQDQEQLIVPASNNLNANQAMGAFGSVGTPQPGQASQPGQFQNAAAQRQEAFANAQAQAQNQVRNAQWQAQAQARAQQQQAAQTQAQAQAQAQAQPASDLDENFENRTLIPIGGEGSLTRKVWVTVDASPDGRFLENCKQCRNGKTYGAYYSAAAHLRRTHFHPRKRSRKDKHDEKRGKKYRGDDPPMDILKRQWMKEVEIVAPTDQ